MTPENPRKRFERSMVVDFDAWHDGTGYDLAALAALSGADRDAVEALLLARSPLTWRDIEALAALDTPAARAALQRALEGPDPDVRLAVCTHAPSLAGEAARAAVLVEAIRTGVVYGGLTQALLEAEEFHPPEVVDALLAGALEREGEVAVHLAALALYLHGGAAEPFDWEHRPFFLRFHTEDRAEREAAFRDLCTRCGRDPSSWLPGW